MFEQYKLIQEQALELLESFQLSLIPICSHNHDLMDDYHTERCNTPGKTPIYKGWSNANLDERTFPSLQEMKKQFRRIKTLNVGLVLGQTPHYNIVGVDIDGEEGLRKWDEMISDPENEVPISWEFWTGGGGYRILYKLPEGMRTKKQKIKLDGEHQEIAFIAQGQQTVLPPSIHPSGTTYEWVEGRSPWDVSLAAAPDWIIARVQQQESEVNKKSPKAIIQQQPIQEGERNDKLRDLIMSFVRKNYLMGYDTCMQASIAFAQDPTKFSPPLTPEEAVKSFEGAWTKEVNRRAKADENAQDKERTAVIRMARYFIEEQKEKGIFYKYRNDRNRFYRCTKTAGPWRQIADDKVMQDTLLPIIIKEYGDNFSDVHTLKKVVELLKSALISDEEIGDMRFCNDENPFVKQYYDGSTLALSNGVLDLKTGLLAPWDPNKHFHTVGFKVRYDNSDVSEELADWNGRLEEWLPEVETRMFLQEYIGYCLTPDCGREVSLMLLGAGANGKSMFMHAINMMFREAAGIFSLNELNDRFFGGSVVDKLLLSSTDMDWTVLKSSGKFKAMVSGEDIKVENKFEKSYSYRSIGKFLFATNNKPHIPDASDGMFRRWRIIGFRQKFTPNPIYASEFKTKVESKRYRLALFQWAWEGLQRLNANNSFTVCPIMEQDRRSMSMDNNPVEEFLAEVCDRVNWLDESSGPKHLFSVSINDLYSCYREWCMDAGEKPIPRNTFVKKLGERYEIDTIRRKSNLGVWATQRSVMGLRFNSMASSYGVKLLIKKTQ